jgi:hypothetical protein
MTIKKSLTKDKPPDINTSSLSLMSVFRSLFWVVGFLIVRLLHIEGLVFGFLVVRFGLSAVDAAVLRSLLHHHQLLCNYRTIAKYIVH